MPFTSMSMLIGVGYSEGNCNASAIHDSNGVCHGKYNFILCSPALEEALTINPL